MKTVLMSLLILGNTAPLFADLISIDLGKKRAKASLSEEVLECQMAVKQQVLQEENFKELNTEALTYELKDIDKGILYTYMWWEVTNRQGQIIMNKLTQKGPLRKCL